MKSPYLNLTFAAFIAVIASTSFVLGFFTGGYSKEYTQEEQSEKMHEYIESMNTVTEIQSQDSFLDVMRQFRFRVDILAHSNKEYDPKFVAGLREDLSSQINSMECMLAKVPNLELRTKIQQQIDDAKPLLQ